MPVPKRFWGKWISNFRYTDMEKVDEIYTFKPEYSKQEIKELIVWFEERMDKLPDELQINKSTRTSDLKSTVDSIMKVLRVREMTVTFCGYAAHLFLIRERLKVQGME